jgi:hypothetical protein
MRKKWDFTKEITSVSKSKNGYKFTGTNIYSINNDYLLFLKSDMEDGIETIENTNLNILGTNAHEKVQKLKTNTSFKGKIMYKNLDKEILLIANDKVLIYEKL